MTTNATAEGHEIIAEHAAGTSQIFIARSSRRRTGAPLFIVNIAHTPKAYITWSQHDTEALARESANRAWLRFSGRETMICG
jgi:hypothetical protein